MLMCIGCNALLAQGKGGLENYSFLSLGKDYVWMPVMHYQTPKGMYAELRYNYEEMNTFSIFGGKTLTTGKEKSIAITPMIGFSAGDFSGASVAANTEIELSKFFISSQAQYSMSFKKDMSNFFFSWSELGYDIFPNLFAGLSFQYTRVDEDNKFEPGFMAGVSFKNISIPVYFFNPFRKEKYIIVGLNYEYHLKRRK